jgi:bifunctional UDP-N-acetylglucosamine pyrophosphorylase/glucosamine-1-phosphate N-acetyltransferase
MNSITVIILAAGEGKRMKSNIHKSLHKIKGESMIVRLINQVLLLNPQKIIVVVGNSKKEIENEITSKLNTTIIQYVHQQTPLGTADAVKCCLPFIETDDCLILNSDTPLLEFETMFEIYADFVKRKSEILITGIYLSNPTDNGRLLINKKYVERIIEEKDCDDNQKQIKLVNCGIYFIKKHILLEYIPLIKNNNKQKEYYLTDIVGLYKKCYYHILPESKKNQIYNINTIDQLNFINSI